MDDSTENSSVRFEIRLRKGVCGSIEIDVSRCFGGGRNESKGRGVDGHRIGIGGGDQDFVSFGGGSLQDDVLVCSGDAKNLGRSRCSRMFAARVDEKH